MQLAATAAARQMALLASLLLLAAVPAQAEPKDVFAGWPNRGRLGVEVQSMTDALREYFGAPEDRGVLVVRVEPERPAAAAGLAVGDVVVAAGGSPIDKPLDLINAVAGVPAGEKLALEVVRKGKTETLEVEPDGEAVALPSFEDWHGLRDRVSHGIREGTDEILRRLEQIERRLERMEQQPPSAPPAEDRT